MDNLTNFTLFMSVLVIIFGIVMIVDLYLEYKLKMNLVDNNYDLEEIW